MGDAKKTTTKNTKTQKIEAAEPTTVEKKVTFEPKVAQTEGVSTALFVMSIVALILSIIPGLGVILAVVACVLLVMTLVKLSKKQIVMPKKGKLIACAIMTAIALLIGLATTVAVVDSGNSKKPKVEQVYSELKQLDVNGLTISEACAKVREAGWKVEGVYTENSSSSATSDCSDTTRKVTKALYQTEKYWSFGDPRNDFESVKLYFAGSSAGTSSESKPETKPSEDSSSSSNNSGTSSSSNSSSSSNNSGSTSNAGSSNSSSSSSSSSSTSGPTTSQKNALRSAKDYLAFTAFSRDGLISQLEFEKYSHADAVYAVDNCGADWYEQAAKSAREYLEFSAFSRDGLIDQLVFEKFTYDQAVYGVNAAGL